LKKAQIFLIFLLILGCSKKKNLNETKLISKDSIGTLIKDGEKTSLTREKRISSLNKSFDLIIKSGNSLNNRNMLAEISEQYYKLDETKMQEKTSKVLLTYATLSNDTLNIASSYNLIGKSKLDLYEIDSSYYYFLKAEKLYLILKDSSDIAKNFIAKSNLLYSTNNYLESEQSAIEALKFINKEKDLKSNYLANNLIGLSSNGLKNYSNSIIYLNNALQIALTIDTYEKKFYVPISFNNIGFSYQNNNDHIKAIEYFKEGLKSKYLLPEMPDLFANLTDNYAYSKFKLKDYSELPGLFHLSLKLREKNQLYDGVILSKIHLSEYYREINDSINSKKFAYDALKLAKSTKVSSDILASLKQLSNVDIKNAAKYSQEYIRLNDSVQNEERKVKDRFARIAYETDEIIQQKSELEVENRNLIYYLFATAGIFALLYIVRSQKAKNRELALKQQQQEVNEEIYNLMISQQATIEESRADEKKRMAQELHDGVLSKMFGTRLNLDSLNDAKDKDSIDRRYTYIQELKNIEQEIREISHDLSSEKEKLINNFVGIVLNLLEEQKNSFTTELTYSFDKKIKWDMLNNTAKINLYRILQETLQNCNKYAKAKAINVDFKSVDENIVLTVSDDGLGFDLNKKKKGIGLKNMVARAEESGGKYEINSLIDQGTSTTVIIPLNAPKPNQT
jgi:signal transduction histidine kinase